MPRNRNLANKVWVEMNQQISNYIRGKVLEIIIVDYGELRNLRYLDLRYSVLLSACWFLCINSIHRCRGCDGANCDCWLVPVGIDPQFYYLLIAYAIIQALDGNVLVPVLFSAVNLHPVTHSCGFSVWWFVGILGSIFCNTTLPW